MAVSYCNGLVLLLLFITDDSLSNSLKMSDRKKIVESILNYALISDCPGTVIVNDFELDEDGYINSTVNFFFSLNDLYSKVAKVF